MHIFCVLGSEACSQHICVKRQEKENSIAWLTKIKYCSSYGLASEGKTHT